MSHLKISPRRQGQVVILDVAGDVTMESGSAELRETISNNVDRGSRKILVNLRGVTGVDAGALRELVDAADMTERYGGRLKLVHLPAALTTEFDAANRDGELETFKDEREAVVSFSAVTSARPPAF